MDELQLTETEQRYFSDLFVCCDTECSGKVSVNNAFELFRSGNVPTDTLNQVLKQNSNLGKAAHSFFSIYRYLRFVVITNSQTL